MSSLKGSILSAFVCVFVTTRIQILSRKISSPSGSGHELNVLVDVFQRHHGNTESHCSHPPNFDEFVGQYQVISSWSRWLTRHFWQKRASVRNFVGSQSNVKNLLINPLVNSGGLGLSVTGTILHAQMYLLSHYSDDNFLSAIHKVQVRTNLDFIFDGIIKDWPNLPKTAEDCGRFPVADRLHLHSSAAGRIRSE